MHYKQIVPSFPDTVLKHLTQLIKPFGVTKMFIIGSYARNQSAKGQIPPYTGQTPHSDLDILCRWKSKHHWAANSNTLAEFLSRKLKIKIDLTAPFHHENCNYNLKTIPSIQIF